MAVIFFVTDIVTLHTLEFTTKYIYISTNGFQDKINDKNNYYFENNEEESSINSNELEKLTEFFKMQAVACLGVRSADDESGMSLESFNDIGIDNFKLGDIVNFNKKYDENFFKKKSLYFSFIELNHPDDKIEVTDFKYAKSFGRLYINYSNPNPNPKANQFSSEEEGAICIMVFEVTKVEEEKLLSYQPSFLTDQSVLTHS